MTRQWMRHCTPSSLADWHGGGYGGVPSHGQPRLGGLTPPPSPPPWLATAGRKWLGGNLAKINENEEKRPHLGSLGVQAIPF